MFDCGGVGGGGCAGVGMSVVSKVDQCLIVGGGGRLCRFWNVCCKQS